MCVENVCIYVHVKFETKIQKYVTCVKKTNCPRYVQ